MATTSSVTALAFSSSSSPLIRRASFIASLEHVNNWDVHNADTDAAVGLIRLA
ncbi:hypothetical protein A1F99_092070 [Pyrenophora tritici-repentis]|nr:hypothetical protein A1F99_092070 [Pyrenophora tritici-repentis]